MEKQTKNLGHVTAYGYAKAQGYTGTEEEYAQLMASYATVAERAEAAAQEAAESAREVSDVIPEVTAQDNGKVMMVENGEWGAGEVDVLPTVTTQDNGKVLGVVEGQWAKTEPEDGLPEVTSSDNGKVLSVVEGEWAPAEPTGGSGLPEVTSEDNGDLLTVVDGAWAKSEPGYRVEQTETVIAPEQSVTTAAQGNFAYGDITNTAWPTPFPTSVKVTLNGTEYSIPKFEDQSQGIIGYGEYTDTAPSFANYPCFIVSGIDLMIAPEAGTYTLEISAAGESVVPSDDFKSAVKASGVAGYDVSLSTVVPSQGVNAEDQSEYSEAEMHDAEWPDPLPDSIIVTVNGTDYEFPKYKGSVLGGGVGYGAFDDDGLPVFSTYPYAVVCGKFQDKTLASFMAPEPGGYIVAVRCKVVTPTEDFKLAVKACGAPGYDVSTDEVQIAAEQSVTTASQGPYNVGQLTATFPDPLPDSVNVTFNGTSYENVPQHADASLGGIPVYGDSGFEEYPFVIAGGEEEALLVTQAAGTYTITITAQVQAVTPDDNFKAAVKATGAGQEPLIVTITEVTGYGFEADVPHETLVSEYQKGRQIVLRADHSAVSEQPPHGFSVEAFAIAHEDGGTIAFDASLTFVNNGTVYTISMTTSGSNGYTNIYENTTA